MDDIYTIRKLLVLLEIVDAGMNDDASDPAFEGTAVLKLVDLGEYLDETFLEHVLGVFPALGIPVAYRQHLGTVSVIQFLLC
jgi:hypothetical protein